MLHPLAQPQKEAPGVEENDSASLSPTLDHELGLRGRLLARVARLAVSRPAPHARHRLHWKTTVQELHLNEETKGVDDEAFRPAWRRYGNARFTVVSASRRWHANPKGRGAGRPHLTRGQRNLQDHQDTLRFG